MLGDASFRFDVTKATEATGPFLKRKGGAMNTMKLVKLVYLLDRALKPCRALHALRACLGIQSGEGERHRH